MSKQGNRDMEYAGRGTRLLGALIDGLIAAVPVVAGSLAGAFSRGLGGFTLIIGVCVAIAYFFFADGLKGGGSYAKQMLNMAVVDSKTQAPGTYWQSFIRNVVLAVLGPIDWIFIFGEKRQRLGDMAAGTVVIKQ